MDKVSVIIPSLFEVDGEYLKLCVESLRDSGFVGQIIVVTNGTSSPPVLSHIKGISIHLHTKTQGQCNAVNIGAQVATGDYLMVSNSDMYYAPGWDKNLRFDYPVFSPNLMEPTDNAGSAPPFLKVPGGLNIEAFNNSFVNAVVTEELDEFDFYDDDSEDNRDPGPRQASGFNLPFFIKRDVWQTIEGYDVAYDPLSSNSDTDLQTKIELAGIQPMRLRDVLVYHFSNKSGTFDFSQEGRQALWQHNWDYYREKWGYTRDDVPQGDPWYARNMVNRDKLIYHPPWEGKYAKEK